MDLEYSAAEKSFRDEIRAFIGQNLPKDVAAKVLGHKRLSREDIIGWHRILHTRGWSAPDVAEGIRRSGLDRRRAAHLRRGVHGRGRAARHRVRRAHGRARHHEIRLRRAAAVLPAAHPLGRTLVVPGLHASPARAPTSPRSRPPRCGAATPTSSMARRRGTRWAISRTGCSASRARPAEGRSQEGISFLLIDMKSKGISVRPIALIDGEYEVNEVWLDDVEVPVDAARRRGEQGLDVREVPADARAREHRAAR